MRRRAHAIRIAAGWLAIVLVAGCADLEGLGDLLKGQPAPLGPRVYVANESADSVTVVDAMTFKVIATVDTKNHSTHDLALSRDGSRLFATNLASGRLSVIDTRALETIASIYSGSRSHVAALTHDDRHVWVANIGEDNVSIVDAASYRVVGTISVGKGPTGLAFSRDGKFAYVSNQGDRTVSVIETGSLRVVRTIAVGSNPHFLTLGPDGRIWGANSGGNDIYVIDPASQTKVASFEVGPAPQQIAFAYKGLTGPNAYVTVSGANQVAVVRTEGGKLRILQRIRVGDHPNGIAANSEGTRIFVGNEAANELHVIDTGSGERIAIVPVGRKPIRVVVAR